MAEQPHERGTLPDGPPPDPSAVRDPAGFAEHLRRLKIWAGDPSFEELRRRSGIPASTLSDALRPDRAQPPALDVVRRFVRACGLPPPAVAGWEFAWRRLRRPGARLVPLPRRPAHPEPHLLPHEVRHFVGRSAALDRLDALSAQRSTIVAVTGPPGVGKTSLAVRWGHQAAGDYPDGQLYVDLHGFSRRPALAAGRAVRLFLGALGVTADEVPADRRARLALYRSLVYPRRLLVVLDNARDAEHVRPLIPGGPRCFTVVTSRNRLSGLVAREGAHRLVLGALRPDEAEDLLAALLGHQQVALEPAAARELARLCDHQPLALRVAAARLADDPTCSLAAFVHRLATGDRLAELSVAGDGGTAVGEAFDVSCAQLGAPARRMLGRLARLPAEGFTMGEATEAAPVPAADVRRLLDTLVAASLVEVASPDRYVVGSLLRLYARARPRKSIRPG
jgi:hypothetical protein